MENVLEFDFSSDPIGGVGLYELVADFENGESGVDVQDLTASPGVDSFKEGLEASMAEVFAFSVRLQPDTDSSEMVDSILSLLDGFSSVGQRNNGVEAESIWIRTAVGSGYFIHQTSKSKSQDLLSRPDVGSRYREGDDRAFYAL